MTALTGLQCHVCHTPFPAEALFVCDKCFGPLEAVYDYDAARATMTRAAIEARPRNLWRYRELLPITGEPRTGFTSGFTPLVRADRLAARLGVQRALRQGRRRQPPDAVLQGSRRLGGRHARRRARLHGVRLRLDRQPGQQRGGACRAPRPRRCYVFIPDDLEPGKVARARASTSRS